MRYTDFLQPRSRRVDPRFLDRRTLDRLSQFDSPYEPSPVTSASTPEQIQRQEFDFLNDFYDGDLETRLATERDTRRSTMRDLIDSTTAKDQSLLDDTLGDLATQRGAYRDRFGNLVSGQEAALRTGREGYRDAELADIARTEAEQAAGIEDFIAAQQDQRASFNARGTRAEKALLGGPSSRRERAIIGMRLAGDAEDRANLAALKRSNQTSNSERRRAMLANMTDRERADLNAITGLNLNLLESTAGQERGDTGLKLTGQSSINDREASRLLGLESDIANQTREDSRYLLGNQTNLLGTRATKLPKVDETFNFDFLKPKSGDGVAFMASPQKVGAAKKFKFKLT